MQAGSNAFNNKVPSGRTASISRARAKCLLQERKAAAISETVGLLSKVVKLERRIAFSPAPPG